MTESGISVVICCHNSADRLPKTLKHLAMQRVEEPIKWEIIVVDNLSKDNTADVATNVWQQLNDSIPLKVVEEKTPGLTNARLKGITVAAYDLIIFCDDDNWLDQHFLAQADKIHKENEDIALFGIGESIPVYEVEPPKWFKQNNLEGMLACFVRAEDEIGIASDKVQICGAGMCITKSLADKYLQFLQQTPVHKSLDRTGNNLNSGGDSDINYMCIRLSLKSGNFKSLKIKHFIPRSRIQLPYLFKLTEGISYSSSLLQLINKGQYNKLSAFNKVSYLLRETSKSFLKLYLGIANLKGQNRFQKFVLQHHLINTNGQPK